MSKTETYNAFIREYVKSVKFIAGKDLTQKLQEQFGMTSVLARKTLSRAVEKLVIKSSSPVTFGNGQFVYMPIGKSLDREMIIKITERHRPPLFRILKLMEANKGIISYYEILKVAGAALDGEKTKTDTLEKLIAELTELGVAQAVIDTKEVRYLIHPVLSSEPHQPMERHFMNMVTDAMFIPDILRSLKAYNIIGELPPLYRNKNTPSIGAKHNNFVWDAMAYTKTTGINKGNASLSDTPEKQTLVVLDIVVSRVYTQHDLNGFLSRVQSVINSVKEGERKIMPIIIYSSIESKLVYNKAHKLGFMTFDMGAIYGSKIYDVIQNLRDLRKDDRTFSDVAKDTVQLIEETLTTFRDSGQEDNLRSIKGDLFEFLMRPLMKQMHDGWSFAHGRNLKNNANKEGYEYDFIISSPDDNEILIVELKGYTSRTTIPIGPTDPFKKHTVRWFFRKTFPFASSILGKLPGSPRITGCMITTANYSEEAIAMMEGLNKIENKVKPSRLDTWYDGTKLMVLLDKHSMTKERSIIEKYYIEKNEEEQEPSPPMPVPANGLINPLSGLDTF